METRTLLLILSLVGGGVLLFLAIFGSVLLLIRTIDRASGGWRTLAERYQTAEEPPQNAVHGQTVKAGAVRYKRCAIIGGNAQGLYLGMGRQLPLLRHPALWIPWEQVTAASSARLDLFTPAVRLAIGSPPIGFLTLPHGVLEPFQTHLKGHQAKGVTPEVESLRRAPPNEHSRKT